MQKTKNTKVATTTAITALAAVIIAAIVAGTFVSAASSPSFAQTAAVSLQQGTITSSMDPLPGHAHHQLAMILPPRNDSGIYSGVLTFTATKKVEVVVLHAMTNKTSIPNQFGSILSAIVPPDNKTRVAITLITPDYGTSPVASASIPFTGNAIALHTLSGEPFAATYSVSYQVGKAKEVNEISTSSTSTTTSGQNMTSSSGMSSGMAGR